MTLTRLGILVALSSTVVAVAVATHRDSGARGSTAPDLAQTVEALTSPQADGRFVGSAGEMHAAKFLIAQLSAAGIAPVFGNGTYLQDFEVAIGGVSRKGHNIGGLIPATDADPSAPDASVAIGAHFDHLGADGDGKMLPGADDNASGVAAVLAASHRLAAVSPRHRNVLVFFWSGEEQGCVGSRAVIDRVVNEMSVVAYVNLDMVGRNPDGVGVEGIGSGAALDSLITAANAHPMLSLNRATWFGAPTDAYTFVDRGIPTINLTTGKSTDYHQATDTADKLTYGGLARISQLAEAIVVALTNGPAVVFHKPSGASGSCQ